METQICQRTVSGYLSDFKETKSHALRPCVSAPVMNPGEQSILWRRTRSRTLFLTFLSGNCTPDWWKQSDNCPSPCTKMGFCVKCQPSSSIPFLGALKISKEDPEELARLRDGPLVFGSFQNLCISPPLLSLERRHQATRHIHI